MANEWDGERAVWEEMPCDKLRQVFEKFQLDRPRIGVRIRPMRDRLQSSRLKAFDWTGATRMLGEGVGVKDREDERDGAISKATAAPETCIG